MADQLSISIVIPTLNEASHLQRTLEAIDRNHVCEVIVADGGSADETAAIANGLGAKVVSSSRGSTWKASNVVLARLVRVVRWNRLMY